MPPRSSPSITSTTKRAKCLSGSHSSTDGGRRNAVRRSKSRKLLIAIKPPFGANQWRDSSENQRRWVKSDRLLGVSPLDTSTWGNPPGIPISGGGAWTSYTLDPATGELYVPVGNPSPVYAIDVREGENLFTNSIVVLDARTGAYKRHFKLVPRDWHDWDVSNPPALIRTMGGKKLLSAAPKDGYLYGIDLSTNAVVYRVPVTKFENADAPFSVDKEVHFCPGSPGGAEWNGPAYDPPTNLVIIGEIDWC